MNRTKVYVQPELYWSLCVCIFLLPLRIILAWFASVAIHEAAHYMALRLCQCNIYKIQIGILGARMETGNMSIAHEMICAAAGPVSGLLFLPLVKSLPVLSVFCILHAIINLIPVYPLDGGRVMRSMIKMISGSVKGELAVKTIEYTVLGVLAICSVYGMIKLLVGPIPLIWVIFLYFKNKKVKSS